jgi:microcystin-dependent protein
VIGGVPAGAIMSFAMSSAPAGWVVCNGAEYAIADYGDLHTAIGTTWGALTNGSGGAGSTHFRVPDLRGAFLRGTGTGTTPLNSVSVSGGSVGTKQEPSSIGTTALNGYPATNRVDIRDFNANFDSNTNLQTTYIADLNSSSSGQYIYYRSTVRPYNASIQYCIKY